ncbi:epoxide hydrolase N-terminal domain-containing protein [Microbacterium amylolyticum]|uniref:Ser/Thr protein kinase RdoA (MazF antagonist) n=1 Tax=Microbacterium amylolyticum TaxID=936337 RepID=A0ABS4ZE98_9MICO|nr:epoxide hydrolase N-terminal domain-containing protein [Microbacterium amylolyticum]MBP2435613.1 Ser/Thr protein kinase RdoA (MazF antagonist) [Microbacterium amylolyticum]
MSTRPEHFFNVPDSDLDRLARRLHEAVLPDQTPGPDWSRGIPTRVLERLRRRWIERYDWRQYERALNREQHSFYTSVSGPLHYVCRDGDIAIDAPQLDHAALARVGRMIREIHDASVNVPLSGGNDDDVLIPAPHVDLFCHNDLAPWNLVLGDRWVFIDWDSAGPSSRIWDLAYAAQSFTLNDASENPDIAAV